VQGLQALGEQRIREAIERGELDNLPGAGRPLEFNEDPLVPAEIRTAQRLLKQAGIVPLEILERKQLVLLERAAQSASGVARAELLAQLALLRTRLEARRGRSALFALYQQRRFERSATFA
jgi:hypothetical protein